MSTSPEKQIENGVRELVARALAKHSRPGWLPCASFGLSAKKAKRLGLRIVHVGKTPYVNVDEFNRYAEERALVPSNDVEAATDADYHAAFGVAPRNTKRGAR